MVGVEKRWILAGDIGGTKTNLGLFQDRGRRPAPGVIETFSNVEAENVESIVTEFLTRHPCTTQSACLAVAGPVMDGRCRVTNLPWEISESRLKQRFKWSKVRLLNDLEATAAALPLLNPDELFVLNEGKTVRGSQRGLLAPGTGLGMSLLIHSEGQYIPVSSEGGHTDFAPNSTDEAALWSHLHDRFGHVGVERVASGPGLLNIYAWLKDSGRFQEPAWLAEELTKSGDAAAVVSRMAMEHKDPLCEKALDVFVSVLGAVAGNLALMGMCRGGIYLGGGIPPKILPRLQESLFLESFAEKGRFQGLLQEIPVRVILNDKAALLGAAEVACRI